MKDEEPYQPKITPWDIPEMRVKISKSEWLRQLILWKLENEKRDREDGPPSDAQI